MVDTGYPSEYGGTLRAKFISAAKRQDEKAPRVFKNPEELARDTVRACNAGALLHLLVAEALDLGIRTKKIHQTLRNVKQSEITGVCRKIIAEHEKYRFFDFH